MGQKFFYVANIRLPTEKAHGIQIMEMCQAFSNQGMIVNLLVPKRFNPIKKDPFSYHDVKKVFLIKKLPCIDLTRFGRFGFLTELISFAFSVAIFSIFQKSERYYTRDELIAVMLSVLGKNVIWEAHMGQKNKIVEFLIHRRIPIVVITNGLRDLYLSMGVDSGLIITAPDGADIDRFNINISQIEARRQLGLQIDKKIILYKGHLYEHTGSRTLADSMKYVTSENLLCVFIGGTDNDLKKFNDIYKDQKNILILGHKPRPETPIYQKAADILVIPNGAVSDITRIYASPMKLFGYLASKVPIIASELPSHREILSESTAYFFEPDNPVDLAKTIDYVSEHEKEALKKANEAFNLANKYTWTNRSKDIINFMFENFEHKNNL